MDARTCFPQPVPAPDLLLRPAPGREEGPQGYLLRLAEANCLPVAELAQLGVRYDPVALERHRVLPDIALDPDLHAHVGRLARAYPSRIWNTRHARFCPLCLAEEGRWRASWELYFVDVCPRHGVWLVDQCGSCGQPVRWKREALFRCQCGSDLRQETAVRAPEHPRRLSALLEALLLGRPEASVGPPLAGLSVEQVQRLVRYLGAYMDPAAGVKPLKLRNAGHMAVSWPLTSLAAELLFDWPRAFHQSLSRLQKASGGEKTKLRGLFLNAYQYLYRGFPEPAFRPLREALESWLVEYWEGGLSKRNRRLAVGVLSRVQWIPGSTAASRLQISVARLRSFVREGRIHGQESVSTSGRRFLMVRCDHLEQISAELAGEMTMSAAIEALGIGKLRMQRILRLLFPSARRTFDRAFLPWCVPRAEVDALLRIASRLPSVSIPEENQVSLAYVLKYWCWSAEEIVALVEAVKEGSLRPQSVLDNASGISRWVFETAQLRAWQQGQKTGPPSWISIPEFGRMLGVKQHVAYWLAQNGLVSVERLGRAKGGGSRLRREEVERFRRIYVFGREIAGILRTSPKQTRRILAAQGIYPIQGLSGTVCPQVIYAQGDEIEGFLAQASGASPETFRLVRNPGCEDDYARIIVSSGSAVVPPSDSRDASHSPG